MFVKADKPFTADVLYYNMTNAGFISLLGKQNLVKSIVNPLNRYSFHR